MSEPKPTGIDNSKTKREPKTVVVGNAIYSFDIGFTGKRIPDAMRQKGLSFLKGALQQVDFQGNIDNATQLLWGFVEGAEFVYGSLATTNPSLIKPTYVVLEKASKYYESFCNIDGEKLCVNNEMLELHSQQPPTAFHLGKTEKEEIAYTGERLGHYQLCGVEEMAEALFMQTHPTLPGRRKPNRFGHIATYDASDVEFFGLEWRLRFAEEFGFDYLRIHKLKQRIANAQAIREKKKTGKTP